jgi:hypothetical protein
MKIWKGHHKEYYENGQLDIDAFYKNNKREGEFKIYDEEGKIWHYSYYIKGEKIIEEFNFKIRFALLKFKDILKIKVRKPIYNELDKYNIKDISNIIGSYLFTLSKLNLNGKRV